MSQQGKHQQPGDCQVNAQEMHVQPQRVVQTGNVSGKTSLVSGNHTRMAGVRVSKSGFRGSFWDLFDNGQ